MPFLFYASLILIVYGSLYPFDFSLSALGGIDIELFLADWRLFSSRGDLLGNIGLFLPYGFFGMLAVRLDQSKAGRFAVLAVFGLFVAAWLQFLQLALPSRDAALGDVIWNAVGLALGAAAAAPSAVRGMLQTRTGLRPEVLPLTLLVLWISAELAPFVPSIDFQSFKDSVRPLMLSPRFDGIDFLRSFAGWLIFAFIACRSPGLNISSGRLLLIAAGTMAAKIVIVNNTVSLSDIAGVAAALGAVMFLDRSKANAPRLVLGILAAYFALSGLEPFSISAGGTFHWIPFAGSLGGSMLTNLQVMAAKIFFIGAIFLVGAHARIGLAQTAIVTVSALMTLEILQLWIGDHTAEITDPLIAALIASCLTVYRRRGGEILAAADGRGTETTADKVAARPQIAAYRPGTLDRAWLAPSPAGFAALALAVIVVALVLNTLLGLPKVPYNVRELFGGNESWWRLGFFALAVFSFGMGGTIAGHRAARSALPWLALPFYAIAATIVIYVFLSICFTSESLADVAGSSNTYFFVTEKKIWGETGVRLYQAIGSKSLIAIVERVIRFVALFGPFLIWLAVAAAVYFRVTGARYVRPRARVRILIAAILVFTVSALPWLYLFKYIAFDASSTDNLNELIVDNGAYLYLLMVLLPVNMIAVAHVFAAPRISAIVIATAVVAMSLPLGWYLFTSGFSAPVEKYGLTFTGADFLLGPDRRELLPDSMPMMRWTAIQIGTVAALAFGMRVLLRRQPQNAAPDPHMDA
ncbi:MAG: VanZ family protein [Alphaproteobacteria bacterium]